jgi:DNA-binding transcriptional ArsR family regulator
MSSEFDDGPVFRALAAPVRREILDLLKDAPRTTGDLCDRFPDLDRCTVMQHLKVLEEADLVIARRQGRRRWNHLNPLPIKHSHDRWIGPYARYAVSMLDRLKVELEGETARRDPSGDVPLDSRVPSEDAPLDLVMSVTG